MDPQAKVDILNRVLHGTVNSVVQYIGISAPHVPDGREQDLEALKRMQGEEAETAHEINALVSDLDGVPSVGVFEYWNVDLNYLDLGFLARFAAKHQAKVIALVERDIDGVRDDARVHGLLRRILEQKRAHLSALQEIGGKEG
ncbi:MAG: hypothetical protein ACYSX0_06665 [Planctomycetota bacterium]|jgi:hypothetical protein